MNTYYTHDNGSRPFKVVITNHMDVEVYKFKGNTYEVIPLIIFEPNDIFIGKSNFNEMTAWSDGYGREFDGNSILLHIDKHEYILIGQNIFSFRALNKIIEYSSPIGNNDVPYPYAIDEKDIYYLFTENVILKIPELFKDNPYQYYYKKHLLTSDEGFVIPKEPVIKNFQGIDKFFIGKTRFTLNYTTKPEEEYDRYSQWEDFGDGLSLLLTNGKVITLNKNKYVKLIQDFGDANGFMPLIEIKELQQRLQ